MSMDGDDSDVVVVVVVVVGSVIVLLVAVAAVVVLVLVESFVDVCRGIPSSVAPFCEQKWAASISAA